MRAGLESYTSLLLTMLGGKSAVKTLRMPSLAYLNNRGVLFTNHLQVTLKPGSKTAYPPVCPFALNVGSRLFGSQLPKQVSKAHGKKKKGTKAQLLQNLNARAMSSKLALNTAKEQAMCGPTDY